MRDLTRCMSGCPRFDRFLHQTFTAPEGIAPMHQIRKVHGHRKGWPNRVCGEELAGWRLLSPGWWPGAGLPYRPSRAENPERQGNVRKRSKTTAVFTGW